MDEFTAVSRAREFVRRVKSPSIPASIEAYAKHVGATLRLDSDLGPDEPGYSFESKGGRFICLNCNDRESRRRFTACHEIAHIALGLPSDHAAAPWWSYAKRSPDEVCCDVFAAELLLQYELFAPLVEHTQIGFAAIEELADRFLASETATGSRFAMVISAPCAFVLSEQGQVRYASRSKALRDAQAWIPPRMAVPTASLSAMVRAGGTNEGTAEVAADLWFDDWRRGGVLLEEARHLGQWDQTLTLLWFEDEEVPVAPANAREEDLGLRELDGTLPWPGKKRRR